MKKNKNTEPGKREDGEDDVRKTLNQYFENLYKVDTEKQVIFNMCGFDIQKG